MSRARGWTLIELMAVVCVMTTVGGAVLAIAATVRGEERLSAACANDLTTLRRAVEALETDLRAAKGPGDLAWKLEGDALSRDGRVVAHNVARFETEWKDDLVTVTLALGPRTNTPHRRDAVLRFLVHRRVPAEAPR